MANISFNLQSIKDYLNQNGVVLSQQDNKTLGSIFTDCDTENETGEKTPDGKLTNGEVLTFFNMVSQKLQNITGYIVSFQDVLAGKIQNPANKNVQQNENIDFQKVAQECINYWNAEFPDTESATKLWAEADLAESKGNTEFSEQLRQKAYEVNKKYNDNLYKLPIEEQIKWIKQNKYADCGDRARIINQYLNSRGIANYRVDICGQRENKRPNVVDHEFIVIGLDKNADKNNPSTWGENAVIVDAWERKAYSVEEGIKRYKEIWNFNDDELKNKTVYFRCITCENEKNTECVQNEISGIERTKQDYINLGKTAIEQFNKNNPNAESSTFCEDLAEYLNLYGNDSEKLAELKNNPAFSDLAKCLENYQNGTLTIEQLKKKAQELDKVKNKNININCGDRAIQLQEEYQKQGIPCEVLSFADVDNSYIKGKIFYMDRPEHAFCVIGLDKNADTTDPSTWGENAVIVDAWLGKTFSIEDGISYYKEFFRYNHDIDENGNNKEHTMYFGTREQLWNLYKDRGIM